MSIVLLLVLFCLLFILELIYFKIADRYNIIDHPNFRSSHSKITIRGGGIIFTIALLVGSFLFKSNYNFFLTGLLLISFISFIDDIKTAGRRVRILFHLASVAFLFYQLSMFNLPFYWILLGFILAIGTINAVNFMDGINGITGGYSLVTLVTLYYINKHVILFTDTNCIIISILSLLVFNFFNFRTKAKCFAGDVGSVSIAFIILFFLLQLIVKTNNLNYLLLLLVYGLDATTTILFRLLRKENIFEAHRNHFYQFLVNEKKLPHLVIAAIYGIVQGSVNIILIVFLPTSTYMLLVLIAVPAFLFICTRMVTEGPARLLKTNPTHF